MAQHLFPRGAIVTAAALSLASAAHAELVVNGGFETGSFTGWTFFGSTVGTGVGTNSPHEGNYIANFGNRSLGGITQLVPTVAGASYDVSFFFRHTGGTANHFAFNWDGGPVEWSNDNIIPGFATLLFDAPPLVATSNLTELRFEFSNGSEGLWSLDGVSVQPHGVPEPATYMLLGLALVLLYWTPPGRKPQE